jgi:acyl carrier protein
VLYGKKLFTLRQASRRNNMSTEKQSIEERLKEIIIKQLDVDKKPVTLESSFINDLDADSLDIVELVMEFEDVFDINIPDEDAEKIQTVGDAVKYIKEHTQKNGA